MQLLLEQVSALLVRALPTFVVVVLLYFYLRAMFFRPMGDLLAQRKRATEGTRKSAEESLRRAGQKAAEYEESLRAARTGIYKEQEDLRRRWREEQAAQVAAMREQVSRKIQEAGEAMEAGKQAVKAGLGVENEALAERIVGRILTGRAV